MYTMVWSDCDRWQLALSSSAPPPILSFLIHLLRKRNNSRFKMTIFQVVSKLSYKKVHNLMDIGGEEIVTQNISPVSNSI